MISIFKMGIIFLICLVGELISKLLPFTFPAGVIRMILMFLLLLSGILKTEQIQHETDFLLQNMAMFYIPAGVAMIDYLDLIRDNAVVLFIISMISMLITFGVTAYTVVFIMRWQNRLAARREAENAGKEAR